MSISKKKLYVGCALTTLPADKREAFLEMIIEIKKRLSDEFTILEFIGIADPNKETPREVYLYDIRECVMKADCMLAICDYPALGLGYEIGTAVEKLEIPVLAVGHKTSSVTRLIRGVDHPKYRFYSYDNVDDIVKEARLHFTPH